MNSAVCILEYDFHVHDLPYALLYDMSAQLCTSAFNYVLYMTRYHSNGYADENEVRKQLVHYGYDTA